jgi:hypothetical protein
LRPNNLVVAIALLCCALTSSIVEAKTKKPAQKTSSSRTAVQRNSSGRSTHSSKYSKKTKKGSRYAKARPSGPPRQQAPTADRYAEIQRALAEKGYYTGPVTGQWNADSTDALKRFQADHKLTVDGKIGAKSLIELGLGPKRDALIGEVAKPNEQTPQGQQ